MERGLEARCAGKEAAAAEVVLSERVCWREVLLSGAFKGVEVVMIVGGRGRLETDGLCCVAC